MFKDLLNLVFPPVCPSCDTLLNDQEKAICWACLADIEQTDFHLDPGNNELFFRFAGKIDLAGAAALFYFDKQGKLKEIIKALKYKNQPYMGTFLGEFYGKMLKGSEMMAGMDRIIPVPLHRSRLISRGYNQSEAFARGLSSSLGISVDSRSLRRLQKTVTQTQKRQDERWDNVRDVFGLSQPLGGKVVLVDDVITTGSTLEACIRTLLAQENPPRIQVLCIGMARI